MDAIKDFITWIDNKAVVSAVVFLAFVGGDISSHDYFSSMYTLSQKETSCSSDSKREFCCHNRSSGNFYFHVTNHFMEFRIIWNKTTC